MLNQTNKPKILLIYTGGTIGMIKGSEDSYLPFAIEYIFESIPQITQMGIILDVESFEEPLDSANMGPSDWIGLKDIIVNRYDDFDGFVILHGSDTMAYSASALSFMLRGLEKPVIFTGSQLPIGVLRSDARENLLTAIEIASLKKEDGKAKVPEVSIYFENKLYRANRTTKYNSENFEAFVSPNYPVLAEAGVNFELNDDYIRRAGAWKLDAYHKVEKRVAVLKVFPGIGQYQVHAILSQEGLKGVILETYGTGNAFTKDWFLKELQHAIDKGIYIVNISQCLYGKVDMARYQTGKEMEKIGILSGYDCTLEAAITKLMVILGNYSERDDILRRLKRPLRGEMTIAQ